jgi:hypothetical protein
LAFFGSAGGFRRQLEVFFFMPILSPELRILKEENPDSIAQADLVVGFLALNDQNAIDRAVEKASEGQALDYPDLKTALVLSDLGSQGQTVKRFFAATAGPAKIAAIAPPEAGDTQALLNLLIIASRLKPKIVVVLNADNLTVKRTWLKRLAEPLLQGQADFANPIFARNAIDAPVTNLMVYPMFRALFGRRVRQPILTDWAFTAEVLQTLLAFQDWPNFPGFMAAELTVKALAVSKGFRICQSIMTEGRYGHSNKRMDTPHIISIFKELARGVFETMGRFKDFWRSVSRSRPTSVVGTDLKPGLFPPRYQVRLEELYAEIRPLVQATEPDWRELLPAAPGDPRKLLDVSLAQLNVDAQKWGQLLFYSGGLYEKFDESDRERLLSAITPIFLARFLSFQKQTIGLNPTQVEAQVEAGAESVEKLKKELLSQGAL